MARAPDNGTIWATQLGRTLVSAAQGDPERVASILAILAGGTVRVGAALIPTRDENGNVMPAAEEAQRELKILGTAFYALAAVNEAGGLLEDVAVAIRGQPKQTIVYDVVDQGIAIEQGGGGASVAPTFRPRS